MVAISVLRALQMFAHNQIPETNINILNSCYKISKYLNKTKDWALVQNAALVGVEVSLG